MDGAQRARHMLALRCAGGRTACHERVLFMGVCAGRLRSCGGRRPRTNHTHECREEAAGKKKEGGVCTALRTKAHQRTTADRTAHGLSRTLTHSLTHTFCGGFETEEEKKNKRAETKKPHETQEHRRKRKEEGKEKTLHMTSA